MLLLSPAQRERLQKHFNMTEAQVLQMFEAKEQKEATFQRKKADKHVLNDASFSSIMKTTTSKKISKEYVEEVTGPDQFDLISKNILKLEPKKGLTKEEIRAKA